MDRSGTSFTKLFIQPQAWKLLNYATTISVLNCQASCNRNELKI